MDCVDVDCVCAVALYAAQVWEDCADGVDNDGKGDVDCSDDNCLEHAACGAVAEYAAPFE